MRPHNLKLPLLGGELEVERVPHHTDLRFRLKKGLAGTAVASGAKQPRKPSATLVKGHYDTAQEYPLERYGEMTEEGFVPYDNVEDLLESDRRRARREPPPLPDDSSDDELPPLPQGRGRRLRRRDATHRRD